MGTEGAQQHKPSNGHESTQIPLNSDKTNTKQQPHPQTVCLAVLKTIFNFVLGRPSSGRSGGESEDCHVPKEIEGFGPIPARTRGGYIFEF